MITEIIIKAFFAFLVFAFSIKSAKPHARVMDAAMRKT